MRLRLELFVDDIDASALFYSKLGFHTIRREPGYASLRSEDAELGLAPVTDLPENGPGPGFTQERMAGVRGAGTEIVLEVPDLDAAAQAVVDAGVELVEPIRDRPWGLRDFRLVDPDGYYVRVTTRST